MKSTSVKTTTTEALLGILSMGPMTGYEIRQRIQASIGNFWSESFGQIYPALTRLSKQGLVQAELSGKANRKGYSLTDAGRECLREWLCVMPVSRPNRNEWLLKLFFGNNGKLADTREQLVVMLENARADGARYEAIEADLIARRRAHPGLPYWLMTVRYGGFEARAAVAWAEQTLHDIDQIPQPQASLPQPKEAQP